MPSKDEIVDTRVRIPKELYERIKALSQSQHRSINAQMLVLLERATRQAEKEAEQGNSRPALLAA